MDLKLLIAAVVVGAIVPPLLIAITAIGPYPTLYSIISVLSLIVVAGLLIGSLINWRRSRRMAGT